MEVQSECVEPPVAPQCDPQPTGKINKAAFKLFGKRRTGSGMTSFFSFRNKGATNSGNNGNSDNGNSLNGNSSVASVELVRSKTHDGLTGSNNDADGQRGEGPAILEAGPVKDITLTLEPPPHQHQEDCGNAETEHNLETPTTSVTMTPLHCVAMPGPSGEPDSPFPYTPTDSPLRPSIQKAKASISSHTPSLATPPLDRCSTGDPPSEPSVDRLCSLLFTDVTSLKSFDSLTGCGDIIADADEEGPAGNGGSGTSSSSSGGGGGSVGVGTGRAVGITNAMSRGSPSKTPVSTQLTQPMFSISPSSVPSSLPARARAPPPPQQPPAGSGVVAYMGGGEEMASPEGVDDADMQGLWHMLPSTGDNSPALPRSHQPPSSTPTSTNPPRATSSLASKHLPSAPRSADRKLPHVKTLGLSKIPVGGTGSRAAKPPLPHTHGRHPTSPGEKEPLSDEGYWDTPSATPTATPDESGLQRNQNMTLSRDSCSGDHLYDLYNDPEEEGEEQKEDEDLNSTPSPSTEYKLSPTSQTTPPSSSSSSSFRSMKGSTSLPRESKIPVSSRQASPPHSASQSALSSVLEADSPPPKTHAASPSSHQNPCIQGARPSFWKQTWQHSQRNYPQEVVSVKGVVLSY
ncbi:APC membrane recruitment protein 2 [Collichthys lucidus]|uniref:APC membrane recruitment protein 2 n=1 Tax=Collichthys lucidus TaxID=240159 RepID=A0A4U5VL57_COLLU|nr:APC membrane recruitment protein 2 [Collichthys lucidus]